jgi:diguanylate cyclase (GGDEF)-like protein
LLVIDDGITIMNQLNEHNTEQEFNIQHITVDGELETISREFNPDLIVVKNNGTSIQAEKIWKTVRGSPEMRHIPLVVVMESAAPTDNNQIRLEADEYISHPYDARLLLEKVTKHIRRIRRYVNASPLTGLPGNPVVEEEIRRCLHNGEKIAVAYLDIDYFKSYNDAYGWLAGDRVIRKTSGIILEVTEQNCGGDCLVGHLGGDDFILIMPPELAESICQQLIREFDQRIPAVYSQEDRHRGYILGKDRQGNLYCFPLMTISIAVCTNRKQQLMHPGHIAEKSLHLKDQIKSRLGSNYIIDRGLY